MGHPDMAHIAHRNTCNRVVSRMKAPDNYKIIKYIGFLSPQPQFLEDLFGIRYYTISYMIITKMILINFSFCLSTIHFLEFHAHCKNLFPNKVASGLLGPLPFCWKILKSQFSCSSSEKSHCPARYQQKHCRIIAIRINKTIL